MRPQKTACGLSDVAFAENPQHPTQRFGGAPQQLVADGEQAEILGAEF